MQLQLQEEQSQLRRRDRNQRRMRDTIFRRSDRRRSDLRRWDVMTGGATQDQQLQESRSKGEAIANSLVALERTIFMEMTAIKNEAIVVEGRGIIWLGFWTS